MNVENECYTDRNLTNNEFAAKALKKVLGAINSGDLVWRPGNVNFEEIIPMTGLINYVSNAILRLDPGYTWSELDRQ